MAEHGLTARRTGPVTLSTGGGKIAILALLFVLLAAAIAGVSAALQGPDWVSLWLSLLFALLLAWGLAFLRQPALRAAGILAGVGLLFLLLVPAGLAGKLGALAAAAVHALARLLPFQTGGGLEPNTLKGLLQDLSDSTVIVLQRAQVWTAGLVSGRPAYDPVAAALVWNALVWVVAAWAGWIVEARRNALLAVFPALLLSLSTLSSAQRMSPTLYLMLGTALLLLATVQQSGRQQGWDEAGVAYPARKGRQVLNAALLLTLLLVFFSALLPSLSVQRLRQWITEHRRPAVQQHSGLALSLGILPGGTPVPDSFRAVRSPGLPRDHLIGSGPELSGRVVMTVKVPDLDSLSQAGQPPPLYWRGFTYDVYTGQGWSSSETAQELVPGNRALQAEHAAGYLLMQQDVSPVEDGGGIVYAAGDPVTVNLPSHAAWRSPGDLFGVRLDRTTFYETLSLVPVVDEQALRAAGQKYPDWIRQRFLALPAEVPQRVKALALRLTAAGLTPFDRARAIESYLRTFPYTLDLPRPPLGRDVVDYFLFDLKKGYCDYYASAMVVLARAAGVPARLAVGYATGTYNLNSKRFVVTEADAHSWVEVYFPDVGWVPFEPTASRPALERSEAVLLPAPQTPNPAAGAPGSPGNRSLPWGWLVPAGALALAGLAGAAWAAADEFRLRRLRVQPAAAEIYRRLRRYGGRLAVNSTPGETPYEFGGALRSRLQDLTAQGKRTDWGAGLSEGIEALIDGIVRVSYHPSPAQDFRLPERWRRLRRRLGLVWLLKTWLSIAASAEGRSRLV
jgi:transglutaminase-like putative cysteine protease